MRDEIVGVLLAAGAGRRFGGDKLAHPLADGRPMALVAAANLHAACDRVVVVLRAADHPLAPSFTAMGGTVAACADAGAVPAICGLTVKSEGSNTPTFGSAGRLAL